MNDEMGKEARHGGEEQKQNVGEGKNGYTKLKFKNVLIYFS